MNNSDYLLDHAVIEWEDGTPVSKAYGDIYWHRGAALEEKKSVFVDPALELAGDARQFTIAELGFGFGINTLLTAEHWPTGQRLNIVSIEKHPVTKASLKQLLDGYDFRFATELLTQYPPPYRGQHVIWLSADIRLLLVFDDVDTALANLDAAVDFWYLDGFAPSRNQDMWAKTIYRRMFSRSRPGTGVATYSSASIARNGLSAAGFEVTRVPGFGRKKEMLRATRPGRFRAASQVTGRVLVIGAGLAGRFCAEALANRGVPFTTIDSGLSGPSSIPQLAMFPQLALAAETRYRFSLAASQYMQGAPGFHRSSLRWFGRTPEEAERLSRIQELFPDDIIEGLDDSVRFHHAGWLSAAALPTISFQEDTVTNLSKTADGWQCSTSSGTTLAADVVILATGYNRSLLRAELQVRAIRGQAISVGSKGITEILNGQATVFPSVNGRSVVSGTYARSTNLEPLASDTEELLTLAAALADLDASDVKPMVGIRAVSRDRLPIVGPAPDWTAVRDINRLSALDTFEEGLWFCTAFGSRGATHARLCAEHLVSKLLGEPAALGLDEQAMLSAARFELRDRDTNHLGTSD